MKKIIIGLLVMGSFSTFADCTMLPKIGTLYQAQFLKNQSVLESKGYKLVKENSDPEFTLKIMDAISIDNNDEAEIIGVTLEVDSKAHGVKYIRIAHVGEYLEVPSREYRKQRQVKKLLKNLPNCEEMSKPGFDIEL